MKRLLPIIIISLVVGLLVFYLFNSSNLSKKTPNKEIEVSINDTGFSPDHVVINLGDTIKWVNKGERPHWPASNPHPDHTLYGESGGCISSTLDACKGLKNGETFSFKFEKLGIWPMHDHLSPGLVMVVEVVANSSIKPISKPLTQTGDSTEFRKLSYTDQLSKIRLISAEDPKDAWEYLKSVFIVDGQVVGNAHEFSHIIGNESYRKSGLAGIKICDDTFAFGCFHGVTEEMLLKEGTKVIADIEKGCVEFFPPEITQGYTGCIHGTGHGIYTWESGNINKALNDCDVFSEKYRSYCYDGVFMENSSENEKAPINEENPWKLCALLSEQYQHSCARYQSQIFLRSFGRENSLPSTGVYCSKAPTTSMRETCFQSLGFYVSQTSLGEVNKILEKCAGMPDNEGVSICITGAAIETVFQKYRNFKESAYMLCNQLSGTRKSTCLNNVDNMIK